MTSLQRKLRRAKLGPATFNSRREDAGRAPTQPVRVEADGSYSTLRPTKGWLRVSRKRLRIEPLLAYLLGGK